MKVEWVLTKHGDKIVLRHQTLTVSICDIPCTVEAEIHSCSDLCELLKIVLNGHIILVTSKIPAIIPIVSLIEAILVATIIKGAVVCIVASLAEVVELVVLAIPIIASLHVVVLLHPKVVITIFARTQHAL